jgi:O-antigen/teichoic acid export membrane protein
MSFGRKLLQGSGVLLLANILAKALSLLTLPYLTTQLSPQIYGEAALVSTLISLLSVIALAGMDMSYSRAFFGTEGANTEQVEALIWRQGMVNALLAGAVGALLWYVYALRHAELHSQFAILVGLGVSGSLLSALAQTRARLQSRYNRLALAVFFSATLSYGVMLWLAGSAEVSEYALVSGYVAVYLLLVIMLGMPVSGWFRNKSEAMEPAAAKSILMVGLPGIITAPAYWVISSADRWFLNTYADIATVGVYAVAVSIGTVGIMLNNAVHSAWVPEIVREYETNTEQAHVVIGAVQSLIIVGYALVWLWVCVLAPDLIALLVDIRFYGAVQFVPWLAAGVFFYGCNHLFNSSMLLKRKMNITAAIWILTFAGSLVGNYLLVPIYGAQAAAIVQAFAFALAALLMSFLAYRNYPTSWLTLSLVLKVMAVLLCFYMINEIPKLGLLVSFVLKSVILAFFTFVIGYWCLLDKDASITLNLPNKK